MRVNIYAEEMTDHIEIVAKEIEGKVFTGVRFYLHLPVTETLPPYSQHGTEDRVVQHKGPFMHSPTDDDSSAVTFWGKRDLRFLLRQALAELDSHYLNYPPEPGMPSMQHEELEK